MNKVSVFLSQQVKYVTKLHPVHKETYHMLKLKACQGRNGLTTLANTVSPLFFQNFAFTPFSNSIYCFYIKDYAVVLKYVLN